MQTRKFMLEVDFQTLNEWLYKHGHPMVETYELPLNGFVMEDEGESICMAFIRMVEGGMALAESLVTDPDAPLIKRIKAIDKMTEHVFETAKSRGIKHLIATTESTGVASRLTNRHGFNKSNQLLLVKKI